MDDMENLWITATIGAAICKARESKGLSQSELAALVNASPAQIAHYERGEQEMPLSRLFDIASVLGVTAAEIFGE